VDDDAVNRKVARLSLEKSAFRMEESVDGVEAGSGAVAVVGDSKAEATEPCGHQEKGTTTAAAAMISPAARPLALGLHPSRWPGAAGFGPGPATGC